MKAKAFSVAFLFLPLLLVLPERGLSLERVGYSLPLLDDDDDDDDDEDAKLAPPAPPPPPPSRSMTDAGICKLKPVVP